MHHGARDLEELIDDVIVALAKFPSGPQIIGTRRQDELELILTGAQKSLRRNTGEGGDDEREAAELMRNSAQIFCTRWHSFPHAKARRAPRNRSQERIFRLCRTTCHNLKGEDPHAKA